MGRQGTLGTIDAIGNLFCARRERGEPSSFLQIGAYDGTGDAFQERFLWSDPRPDLAGILIEPGPGAFARLSQRAARDPEMAKRLELLNLAVVPAGGETQELFEVDEERVLAEWRADVLERHRIRPGFFQRISSLDLGHVARHVDKFRGEQTGSVPASREEFLCRYVRSTPVETLGAPALVEHCRQSAVRFGRATDPANPSGIELLIIDAEGLDLPLLEALLEGSGALRPGLIVYEKVHLGAEGRSRATRLLEAKGYRGVDTRGYNALGILLESEDTAALLGRC